MKRRGLLIGALLALLIGSTTVAAQYGWFTQNGGLIARMSSATTAVTIRQDGSGAILDLYAGTTRVFRAISTGVSYALQQTIERAGIGVTSTRGLLIENNTAAAAGVQQYSPMLCQEGQGWKTNATAASQSVEYCWEVQPVQGSAAPTGNLILKASINGGAFSTVGTFTSGGQFSVSNLGITGFTGFTLTNNSGTTALFSGAASASGFITSSAGAAYSWIGRSQLDSTADGNVRARNNAGTNTYDITIADWGTTLSAEGVSVADAGTLNLGAAPLGRLTVVIGTDNDVCTFDLRGSSTATREVTDGGTLCSITKDNASTVNVYYDTSAYFLQNNRGGARTVRLTLNGA